MTEYKCPICKEVYECEPGIIMLICPACQIDILKERGKENVNCD